MDEVVADAGDEKPMRLGEQEFPFAPPLMVAIFDRKRPAP